ncbi:MAG: hypothetical protein ACXVC1_00690 [Tumebacillaceae bacterium]
MITFDLMHLLVRRKGRWLSLIAILALYTIFILINIPHTQSPSVMQLMMLVLNQHFFTVMIIPILFLVLVADLLLIDQRSGYLQYTFVRYRSRLGWFVAKLVTMFFAAFLVTLICFAVSSAIGMIAGLPWRLSDPVLGMNVYPLPGLVSILLLFVFTLTSFGCLVLTVSLFVHNPVFVWVLGSALAMASYFIWFRFQTGMALWMPTTQLLYILHAPNDLIKPVDGFTMNWSLVYTGTLFVVASVAGLWRVRKSNLIHMT